MILLIDTHAFIWWVDRDKRLNQPAADAIEDPSNKVFVSAITVWEIATKRRLGKLAFNASPVTAISANGCLELPVSPMDAELAGAMRWDHKDPFDRFLVAQAMRLGATLVTAETTIRAFGTIPILWAG